MPETLPDRDLDEVDLALLAVVDLMRRHGIGVRQAQIIIADSVAALFEAVETLEPNPSHH